MSKKISVGTALALVFVAIAVTVAVTLTASMKIYSNLFPDLTKRSEMYTKVEDLDALVNKEFYYDIDGATRNHEMASGYIKGLNDPYSRYMTAEEYVAYDSTIRGKSSGIGVEAVFDRDAGKLVITQVFENSPAKANGLQKGDVITKVEDEAVTAENYTQKMELLEGSKLSSVKLAYLRAGETEKAVSVAKGYTAQSVSYEVINTSGYIRITHFYQNTVTQLQEAIEKLSKQNVKSLIIDVRGNASGETAHAISAVDLLVPMTEESALVTAYNKANEVVETYTSDANSVALPSVVLVDSGTSGPAELFAVTLKDFGSQLIGETTAGRGTMSQVFQLNDGSAVVLTVAKLKPYKSEMYDGIGIQPDMEEILPAEKREKLALLTREEDTQLQKAISYLNGTQQQTNAGQS